MAWVVDTCVILDIARNDPAFGLLSAQCLQRYWPEGLVACPVSLVELGPEFGGRISELRSFLIQAGIEDRSPWLDIDTAECAGAWHRYVIEKRMGAPKRPVADILIGGFAARFQGLITRNGGRFARIFPALSLVNPASAEGA